MAETDSEQPGRPRSGKPVSVRTEDIGSWIAAAREGDRVSLGEIFAQCRGYLLAIAHTELDDTLRGKLAVSDVVQETLLRAQQNFAGFRGNGEEELLAWVRQILANYITDVRRSFRGASKRDIGREVRIAGRPDQTTWQLEGLAIDSATPGRAAAGAEEVEKLKDALASLPAEYQTVLRLRTWERLPFAEVGRRMDRTPDAARMLWGRAVQRLTAYLQGQSDEESP